MAKGLMDENQQPSKVRISVPSARDRGKGGESRVLYKGCCR